MNDEPEDVRIPNNPQAKEFRDSHWTIDKAINQGQVKAGEVDEEQRKFLETQKIITPEEVKENGK